VIDRSISCLSYLVRLFVAHTLHFHCRRHVAVLELSSIVAQCKSQASARFSLGDTGLCISLEVLSGVSDIEKFKGGEGSAHSRSMCFELSSTTTVSSIHHGSLSTPDFTPLQPRSLRDIVTIAL